MTGVSQPEPEKQQLSLLSLPALALAFLKIGTIGFGGGMAIIALVEHELVRKRRVIEAEEFLHGVGLGQILGPFAVNTALFIGYRLYGTLGGLIAASAFMAPSLVMGYRPFVALLLLSRDSCLARRGRGPRPGRNRAHIERSLVDGQESLSVMDCSAAMRGSDGCGLVQS